MGADEQPAVPTGDVVLVAGDADELLTALEQSLRDGHVRFGRLRSDGGAADIPDGTADVAIIGVRRSSRRSMLASTIEHARRVERFLTPDAVIVGVSIAQSTSSGIAKSPAKILRPLGRELLHQVQAARTRSSGGAWRSARLRTGLAALQTAGIRVFRISRAGR